MKTIELNLPIKLNHHNEEREYKNDKDKTRR